MLVRANFTVHAAGTVDVELVFTRARGQWLTSKAVDVTFWTALLAIATAVLATATIVVAFATGVAALGTVGALFTALFQIGSERNRRLAQDERDRAERHREQARLIAGWVGPGDREEDRTPFYLLNGSAEPVYNVVATIVLIQGAAPDTGEEWQRFARDRKEQSGEYFQTPATTAAILLPGRWRVWIPKAGWTGLMAGRAGGEVAFTDRAGAHWVRRGKGELEELSQPPFEHFGLHGPFDLVTPEVFD